MNSIKIQTKSKLLNFNLDKFTILTDIHPNGHAINTLWMIFVLFTIYFKNSQNYYHSKTIFVFNLSFALERYFYMLSNE